MKELVDAIAQVGFPIVVSLLLLIRIEGNQNKFAEKFSDKMDEMGKKLDANTKATDNLATIIRERMPRR